jgi:Ku70/Ku80 beta-barrel domain
MPESSQSAKDASHKARINGRHSPEFLTDVLEGDKSFCKCEVQLGRAAIRKRETRSKYGGFVPRSEIDDLYLVRPYYIVPDGKVGHDAFAVIRETIRSLDKVALRGENSAPW